MGRRMGTELSLVLGDDSGVRHSNFADVCLQAVAVKSFQEHA